MKNLKNFIIEKQNFLIKNKNILKNYDKYDYHPQTADELKDIIVDLLKQGETDLNCIDVSKITDMYNIFGDVVNNINVPEIDISEWDVSNVKDMSFMFDGCTQFTSDISNWNVSNVEDMSYMFDHCYEFNSNLSEWDISKLNNITAIFRDCKKLNCDFSNWDISKVRYQPDAFYGCTILKENNKIPKWYKYKV